MPCHADLFLRFADRADHAAASSCGAAQAEPVFDVPNAPAQSQVGPQYALTEQNDANENLKFDPRLQRQS